MIIKGSEFTPAPEGVWPAVCVDVVDLGVVDSQFGKKHKVKLVWEIDQTMEDGKRFTVQKRYNVSLHEKSTLAKDLKAWRGRAFTPDELKGFDLDKILGAPCQLVVQHSENEGATYANVTGILKAAAVRLSPSGSYVRMKDRPDYQAPKSNGQNGGGNGVPPDDDGIPF